MKKGKKLAIYILGLLLCGCSGLKISVAPIKPMPSNLYGTIDVITEKQLTDKHILIGSVFVGDKGLTKTKECTFTLVLEEVLKQAREMGGNYVVITEHKHPNSGTSSVGFGMGLNGQIGTYVSSSDGSTCHQINANVYYLEK